jgi:hypothetical protein
MATIDRDRVYESDETLSKLEAALDGEESWDLRASLRSAIEDRKRELRGE